jgi:hypothetical protein
MVYGKTFIPDLFPFILEKILVLEILNKTNHQIGKNKHLIINLGKLENQM